MTALDAIPALAVVVARDGQLPAGADETAAAAAGAVLLAGSGTREAAGGLTAGRRVWLLEQASFAPAALAAALAPLLSGVDMVLLPASPDGRDLAPRLAAALGRALLAGAARCAPDEVELTRLDDRLALRVAVDGPVVVTLWPGRAGRPAPCRAGGDNPAAGGRPGPAEPPGPTPRASRCSSPSRARWTWPRRAGSWAAAPGWSPPGPTGRP